MKEPPPHRPHEPREPPSDSSDDTDKTEAAARNTSILFMESFLNAHTLGTLLFHVSLLYNLALHHERRRPWWSRVEPLLLLGALPLREKQHLPQLIQEEGVRAIVTMNQSFELLPNLFATPISPLPLDTTIEEWQDADVAQCFGATMDFSAPTVETIYRCVEFIHSQVDVHKKTTYVHCKAGRGRSAVVVVAFLVRYRGMSLEDAIAFTRTKRPHVSLHPKQRNILQEFVNAHPAPASPQEPAS